MISRENNRALLRNNKSKNSQVATFIQYCRTYRIAENKSQLIDV